MSKALEGEHYCTQHQGNHSHYAERNCVVCVLLGEVEALRIQVSPEMVDHYEALQALVVEKDVEIAAYKFREQSTLNTFGVNMRSMQEQLSAADAQITMQAEALKEVLTCVNVLWVSADKAVMAKEVMEKKYIEQLTYSKTLERKLAEQIEVNTFDATRLRTLATKCGISVPESDEELLAVAGVVLGSIRRVVNGLYEAREKAVPEDAARLDWIASRLFEHSWNGVIDGGSRTHWTIPSNWRHVVCHMEGIEFRSALDKAIKMLTPSPASLNVKEEA